MQNKFPAKNSAKNPVFSKLCRPGPDIGEKGRRSVWHIVTGQLEGQILAHSLKCVACSAHNFSLFSLLLNPQPIPLNPLPPPPNPSLSSLGITHIEHTELN